MLWRWPPNNHPLMINKIKATFLWDKVAVVILMTLGILLRLRQYLTGRSLWSDEAMLALNIVNRDVSGLFKPLDYDQGAPIGFLLVEKVSHLLFGRNEYSLRLFPLLIGLVSVWLFYLLLKQITRGPGLFIALALFALNPRLVYYSSEVKQYILDVAVTIGLLLLASRLFGERPQKPDFAVLAVTGFVALWFSHPALFVLAGIGLSLTIIYIQRRDFASLKFVSLVGVFWLVTIGFLYLLILNDLQQNAYMKEYWQYGFFPLPPWSNASWFLRSINENIGIQFGIPYGTYFVFGLMLTGWVILWKSDSKYALTFGLILIITLLASALQLYPVFERMILFLIPIGLLLVGKTVETLYQSLQKQTVLGTLVVLVLAGYLMYGPTLTSVGYFIHPKYYEHIRPAMGFLQEMWRSDDIMYVSNGAVPAFEYYAPIYGLSDAVYLSNGRDGYKDPNQILKQLETLKGHPRVWIFLSHVYEKDDFNEKNFILDDLRQNGKKKREFRVPGSSVYLYLFDLGN